MIDRRRYAVVLLAWLAGQARADQFDQLDGPVLARTLKGPDLARRPSLTISDLAAMPALLKDTRSALVLARTDVGNPARLLVVPEFRKPADGQGEPIPVVVLERLDAFDGSDPSTRVASRRDVVVFDGFQVDLDTGQVVPEGQGGDVVFRTQGEAGPRLESIGAAGLFTLTKAPAFDSSKAPRPTPGKAVVPGDFAGRYGLYADGQWSGTLDLKVEERGSIVGQFRSDRHGTAYPVSGQVATDVPKKVNFAIKYPRARQEFEGYLWAEGKGAIAGVASLNERPAGFFAIREGGRFAPEGPDVGPMTPAEKDRPGRLVIEIVGDTARHDGEPMTLEQLGVLAERSTGVDPAPSRWFLLRASKDQKFADVLRAAEILQSRGIKAIRFETIEPEK